MPSSCDNYCQNAQWRFHAAVLADVSELENEGLIGAMRSSAIQPWRHRIFLLAAQLAKKKNQELPRGPERFMNIRAGERTPSGEWEVSSK
jgi:hypothetical protein